jgi:hypothetical protein
MTLTLIKVVMSNAAAEHDLGNADTLPAPVNRDLQVCYCCCVTIDDVTWASLRHPRRGALQDDGDGGFLELKNCGVCGTTLSRPATREIRGHEVA